MLDSLLCGKASKTREDMPSVHEGITTTLLPSPLPQSLMSGSQHAAHSVCVFGCVCASLPARIMLLLLFVSAVFSPFDPVHLRTTPLLLLHPPPPSYVSIVLLFFLPLSSSSFFNTFPHSVTLVGFLHVV